MHQVSLPLLAHQQVDAGVRTGSTRLVHVVTLQLERTAHQGFEFAPTQGLHVDRGGGAARHRAGSAPQAQGGRSGHDEERWDEVLQRRAALGAGGHTKRHVRQNRRADPDPPWHARNTLSEREFWAVARFCAHHKRYRQAASAPEPRGKVLPLFRFLDHGTSGLRRSARRAGRGGTACPNAVT